MRRLIWVILGIWSFAIVAVTTASQDRWTHPCYTPIAIGLDSHRDFLRLDDYRTGISLVGELSGQTVVNGSYNSRWRVIHRAYQISVIDTETGAFHPQLPQIIEGIYPILTEHSLWFMRDNGIIFSIWRTSLDDGLIQLEYDDMRLGAISPDDRWQFFSRFEDDHAFGEIFYLYDRSTGRRFDFLNVQDAIFSADSRCLIVKNTISQPSLTGILTIYDLKTMLSLHTEQGDPIHYGYAWYVRH